MMDELDNFEPVAKMQIPINKPFLYQKHLIELF